MAQALLIQNVYFNYVHIKTAVLEFEKKADPAGDHMNKEYIVDVLMPFKAWQKFKKHYKAVGAIGASKEYTAAEYEAAFKVAPPEADVYANGDGEYTVIKFRQRAYYSNTGDATKQPRILGTVKLKDPAGNVIGFKDNNGEKVGTEIEVGNGSLGTIQFRERTWTFGGKDGLSLDLVKIQIKELVVYEGSDNDDDFDMTDEEVGDSDHPFSGGDDLGGDDAQVAEPAKTKPKEDTDDDW